jgi:hypothetical protein
MTTTADGTARAAAQLREAARDVALVAERRAAQYEATGNRAHEVTADTLLPVGGPSASGPEALAAEPITGTVITAMVRAGLASATDEDSRIGKSA